MNETVRKVTTSVNHVNFTEKMRELHSEMCNEIALLMRVHHVHELNLSGSDASHAVIMMEDKFTGNTLEVEVEKVILHEDEAKAEPYSQFGEVFVTSSDMGYSGEEIAVRQNQYVIPCSVRDLYEAVYEILGTKK